MKIRKADSLTKQPAASLSGFLPVCSPAILPIGPQGSGLARNQAECLASQLAYYPAVFFGWCETWLTSQLPPAQLTFVIGPKGSYSCPPIQDPELSDQLVSCPAILLSRGTLSVSHLLSRRKLSVSHLLHRCLCFLTN